MSFPMVHNRIFLGAITAFTVCMSNASAETASKSGMVELRVAPVRVSARGQDLQTTKGIRNNDLSSVVGKFSSGKMNGEMPRWISVSLDQQTLKLYQGLEVIEQSNISSGKAGHDTPKGIFTILGKKKYHESNIYSSAPMPYMQRLTWSGIALHESNSVPAYPASHGCVRLPRGFAKQLYSQTSHGIHVIISPEDVVPVRINHPSLFQSNQSRIDLVAFRDSISDYEHAVGAGIVTEQKEREVKPIRIFVTRATRREKTIYVQTQLRDLGYTYEEPDGLYGAMTIATVKRFQAANGLKKTGTVSDELMATLKTQSGGKTPAEAMLYVRRNQEPVFEAPVTLRDPQKPLGSHLLVHTGLENPDSAWFSMSISSTIPGHVTREHDLDPALKNTRVYADLIKTLDRLVIPEDARDFVESSLSAGASFAISDNGLGTETGKGTDFIVQTH